MAFNRRTAADAQHPPPSQSIQPVKRPSNPNTIAVPTKLNDGGSPTNNSYLHTQSNKKIRVADIKKEIDPFLFFSFASNVSKVLLGEEVDGYSRRGKMIMADAEKVVAPSEVRKTKISCEAHPHIFFESLFLEISEDV
eukprot:CAMPEP_0171339576 /NCGR_PEP_ID=MMETSP0878-20121228/8029_1 /TAXON_ID=67004 /ORGANISM="Thalassiosira weissflogii, Strain CCMP1336" /LENGTH=137 /DNA_ID=CAMNT_0011841505 /DNA_START=56 /DNA_END=469 /DNA_ORIENTATION=-